MKTETKIVLSATITFLLFQWLVVGLIPAQVLMAFLFNLLFFAHPITKKLAVTLLPFVLFEISYDWMRLYPNYLVNDIDIQNIYDTEKKLFGISTTNGTLIPCEYFALHNSAIADLLAGLFYLCWVPGPIFLVIYMFFQGQRNWATHLSVAFLLVNFVGFSGYYIHPASPPWYAINYGFTPDFSTPGNAAGLARFDELIGIPVFTSIYVNNSNIFAAVPSLHAAYMTIATFYAFISRQRRWLTTTCCIITLGIWWTAVYTCHHYIIDVLLGILTTIIGLTLFEGVLMHIHPFKRFMNRYINYVS